jgi:hypothetical protein
VKFGPLRAMTFAALVGAAAAAKTFHQPCGQRNDHAVPRADFDIVVVSARRVADFCSRAAHDLCSGDRRRRALFPQPVDETCKRRKERRALPKQRRKNERPGPEGAGPGPF